MARDGAVIGLAGAEWGGAVFEPPEPMVLRGQASAKGCALTPDAAAASATSEALFFEAEAVGRAQTG